MSKKGTPRSRARSTMRRASGAGVRPPKFIVPTATTAGGASTPGGRGSSQRAREDGKVTEVMAGGAR
ncbi:hypothetical protein ACN28S_26680 [Cystobacter fuscus]